MAKLGFLVDRYLIDEHIWMPGNYTCYLLLSDHEMLLNRLRKWQYDIESYPKARVTYEERVEMGNPLLAVQHLLLKNPKGVVQQIDNIKKRRSKSAAKAWVYDIQYLESWLRQDESGMRDAIEMLASPKVHKSRNRHFWHSKDFISIFACFYLKLSWIIGLEFEFDYPWIPMELMPVAPLDDYDIPEVFIR